MSQVGGNHYEKYNPQPGFLFNYLDLPVWLNYACKYIFRAGEKGPAEQDWAKARHCLREFLSAPTRRSLPSELDKDEVAGMVTKALIEWSNQGVPPFKLFALGLLFSAYIEGVDSGAEMLLEATDGM